MTYPCRETGSDRFGTIRSNPAPKYGHKYGHRSGDSELATTEAEYDEPKAILMGRSINKLSARSVEALNTPGWHGDGGDLWLRITARGAKRWVFTWKLYKHRREMGLGSVASVSLASARRKAEEARELLAVGRDPLEAKREQEEAATAAANEARAKSATPTFGEYANTYIESQRAGWRTVKHHVHWRARGCQISCVRGTSGPILDRKGHEDDARDQARAAG